MDVNGHLDKAERRLCTGDYKGAWSSFVRAAFDDAEDPSALSVVLTRGRVLRGRVGDERWGRSWDRVLDALQSRVTSGAMESRVGEIQPLGLDEESTDREAASPVARAARGRNGTIAVSPGSVTININGGPNRHSSRPSLVGAATVSVTDVGDVRWREADPIANGFLMLQIRPPAGGSHFLEATLVFTIRQQAAFILVLELLNQYRRSAQATGTGGVGSADPIHQLERIAALHQVGALTASEFLRLKAKLLARV